MKNQKQKANTSEENQHGSTDQNNEKYEYSNHGPFRVKLSKELLDKFDKDHKSKKDIDNNPKNITLEQAKEQIWKFQKP